MESKKRIARFVEEYPATMLERLAVAFPRIAALINPRLGEPRGVGMNPEWIAGFKTIEEKRIEWCEGQPFDGTLAADELLAEIESDHARDLENLIELARLKVSLAKEKD